MANKLLLADDSITIQKVVELVLAEENFEIRSFGNGDDALKAMDSFRPDIVLADIDMPRVNGYQLCEKIKRNPDTAAIPVILLAGAFEPIDDELASTVGADDSIIKPFESQELISKINAALTITSAEDAEAVSLADAEEEAVELADEAEAAEAEAAPAGAEEDLWAMEDVAGGEAAASVAPQEEAEMEAEETFEIPDDEVFGETAAVQPEPAPQQRVTQQAVIQNIAMPSKEEVLKMFEKAVAERVSSLLTPADLSVALTSLAPTMKDSVEKILWEVAPELVEKTVKEILKGSVSSISAQVEKVIWETVPDLASTMISKEIEKIKSEI